MQVHCKMVLIFLDIGSILALINLQNKLFKKWYTGHKANFCNFDDNAFFDFDSNKITFFDGRAANIELRGNDPYKKISSYVMP